MKVFLSWSGELSQSIACALHGWLPLVVQHVDPWMSNEEIKSGMRWNEQIAEALDQTDFGIVCVTASNQHQPWLMFEAGALAKRLQVARVVPLCIDIAPADVTGPLATFQGRRLNEKDMSKLVQDVMAAGGKLFPPERVAELFKAMWEKLKSKVDAANQQSPDPQTPQRTTQEMLEELVERVRRLDRVRDHQTTTFMPWGKFFTSLSDDDQRHMGRLLLGAIAAQGPMSIDNPRAFGKSSVDNLRAFLGKSSSVDNLRAFLEESFPQHPERATDQRETETDSDDKNPS